MNKCKAVLTVAIENNDQLLSLVEKMDEREKLAEDLEKAVERCC